MAPCSGPWNDASVRKGHFFTAVGSYGSCSGYVVAAIAFYVATVGVSLSYHGLYFFDVNGIASESSTAGLSFVFLPVLALASGALAAGATWALERPKF